MNYLLIPRVSAQNINIAQSPFVYGVPSPPTWMGFADALMREIGIGYGGVGALIHHFEPRTSGRVKVFAQARHPLKKNGDMGSIIEEAKGHITASVLIELLDDRPLPDINLAQLVERKRLAGGFIAPIDRKNRPLVIECGDPIEAQGHWLTIATETFSTLDDWIDNTQGRHEYTEGKWRYEKSDLVPLMIGYAALEPPENNPQSRDPSCPLMRVEALHAAGRWVPHHPRIDKQSVLFRRASDMQSGLFICN